MSKKQLQVEGIINELEGSSLFFTKRPNLASPQSETETVKIETVPLTRENKPEPQKEETVKPSSNAIMHARMHAIKDESMIANTNNNLKNDAIETIRKSVKQVGKEEFYLRLTHSEKSEVTKVAYTFNELSSGEGKKISANDIGRIAIHHLLIDYHENGEKSILVRVLEALNA